MKEKYFTQENLASESRKFREETAIFHNHRKFKFKSETSVLLVLDMQDFFCESSSHAFIPSFESIIPNILELISSFKANNLPVIFTRHLNTTKNACMMGEWWNDLLTEENKFSKIIKKLNTAGCTVLNKSQYDAFYNTNLQRLLEHYNIDNVVITGVMTHLCCESTARSAFTRGFKTFFVIDGTATYNATFHRNTLVNLAHGFCIPVLAQELLEELNV
ncbi:MAG TPA: isochorismatase family protein [Candidatus Gastranaerophilales bacterium]|nr:isochorismatase family protein [Candidatus Gastranaerophilales bacterium]